MYKSGSPTPQEKVTSHWNSMAGEWDDLASGYATHCYELLMKTTINESLFRTTGQEEQQLEQLPIILDFGCGTGLLTEKLQKIASKIIAIDPAPQMIELLQDKIRDMDWKNVEAYTVVLANIHTTTTTNNTTHSKVKEILEEMEGKFDLIVASSVMAFIPEEDLQATMIMLGKLLKKGGLLFHTDWVQTLTDNVVDTTDPTNNDGQMIISDKVHTMYSYGGFIEQSTEITTIPSSKKTFFGSDSVADDEKVYVGMAIKQ